MIIMSTGHGHTRDLPSRMALRVPKVHQFVRYHCCRYITGIGHSCTCVRVKILPVAADWLRYRIEETPRICYVFVSPVKSVRDVLYVFDTVTLHALRLSSVAVDSGLSQFYVDSKRSLSALPSVAYECGEFSSVRVT